MAKKYKKLYGSVLTYGDDGVSVMKPIRVWVHFASAAKPQVAEWNMPEDLPPVPEGCYRSLQITYRTLREGLGSRRPAPKKPARRK